MSEAQVDGWNHHHVESSGGKQAEQNDHSHGSLDFTAGLAGA